MWPWKLPMQEQFNLVPPSSACSNPAARGVVCVRCMPLAQHGQDLLKFDFRGIPLLHGCVEGLGGPPCVASSPTAEIGRVTAQLNEATPGAARIALFVLPPRRLYGPRSCVHRLARMRPPVNAAGLRVQVRKVAQYGHMAD